LSNKKIILRLLPLIIVLASFVALLTGNSCGKGLFPEQSLSASVTVTATPISNAFLYATNFTDGTVSAFDRNTNTGALTFIAKQSSGAVSGPMGIAVPMQNDFAFVANQADGNLYEFEILQSGTTPGNLVSVGSIASGTTPQMVAIDSTGDFVYVTNAGSRTVTEYAINSQVQNVLTANGTISGFTGKPFGIVTHPSAQLAYVSDSTAGLLYAFMIGTDGTLTPIGSPVDSNGSAPGQPGLMAITVDSSGQGYLMVNDLASGILSVFLIQANGTLGFSGNFGNGQSRPVGIAAVNDGGGTTNNYVLTANMTGNFVQPYLRSAAVLQQQTAVTVSTGPTGLVIDPAGLFAYTGNSGNGSIGLIGINNSRCGSAAFCDIENFASENPANSNAGTQFIATTNQ
jgi:DNA-binding beta-propeller fold protein YncE